MKKSKPKKAEAGDDVSVGFWMLALFLLLVPLVNVIAILTFSFVGGNRSRQNFFRALIGWFVVVLCLHLILLVAGLSPLVFKALKDLVRSWAGG